MAISISTVDLTCYEDIGGLGSLTYLKIELPRAVESSELSSEHIEMIGRCSTLEYLSIPVDGLSKEILGALDSLQQLRQLTVVWCQAPLNGKRCDIEWIARFTKLEYLCLECEQGLAHLDVKSIETLSPLRTPATLKVGGAIEASALKALVAKTMPGRLMMCGNGGNLRLPVGEMKVGKLVALSLRDYAIDDALTQDVIAATSIQSLTLEACTARWNTLLPPIAKHLTDLTEVCVQQCSEGSHGAGIAGKDMSALKLLPKLQRLTIQGHLTEGHVLITEMAGATSLEAMLLGSGIESVDERCLWKFGSYPKLKDVRLEEANQAPKSELLEIGEAALKDFRDEHPRIRISLRSFPRK